MQFDNPLDQCKTQAAASTHGVEFLEKPENFIPVAGIDPHAVVAHEENQLPVRFLAGGDVGNNRIHVRLSVEFDGAGKDFDVAHLAVGQSLAQS